MKCVALAFITGLFNFTKNMEINYLGYYICIFFFVSGQKMEDIQPDDVKQEFTETTLTDLFQPKLKQAWSLKENSFNKFLFNSTSVEGKL